MTSAHHKINLALVALLGMAFASCDIESLKFWKTASPVIAEVESSRLHLHELMEIRRDSEVISKEEWAQHIEYWVNFEIMYREALKRGLQKDPAAQKLIKEAQRKILVDRLRLTLEDSTTEAESDKELQEFYDSNRELFRIDSVSFVPFTDVTEQIRSVLLSEKRMRREKKWLTETKNNYSIEIYPQYLDSIK
jgi:hypothetical protein